MNLQIMTILIVDDHEAHRVVLRRILRKGGYTNLHDLGDSREVPAAFQALKPDLLLLDLHMPHMNGFQVMEALRPQIQEQYLPILVLTSDQRREVRQKALAGGAKDFLTKPFDPSEVHLRIHNLLETRYLHRQLKQHNQRLEEAVVERTRQLEQSQIEMLIRLAHASEYRDDESGEHVWRVAQMSALLAREIGLEERRVALIMRAARLHDVGKIGIPDGILLKPTGLTPEEFEVVKTHTTVGAKLLSGGQSELIRLAESMALTHHERWDGSGYPQGLKGEEIPIESRILAVVDTFDALTRDRVYGRAKSVLTAVSEIQAQSNRQFDPRVVDGFLTLYQRGQLLYQGQEAPDPVLG